MSEFDTYKDKWAFDKKGWVCKCGEGLDVEGDEIECSKCRSRYRLLKDGAVELL